MLFSPMGSSSPVRVQGAFVSDDEVSAITHHTATQQEASYDDKYINVKLNTTSPSAASKEEEEDEEYEMCRSFVINAQKQVHLYYNGSFELDTIKQHESSIS